jgi:hypothetical protein
MSSARISYYKESVFYSQWRFWLSVPMITVAALVWLAQAANLSESSTGRRPALPWIVATATAVAGLTGNGAWTMTNAAALAALSTPTGVAQRAEINAQCAALAATVDVRRQMLVTPTYDYWLAYGCYPLQGLLVRMTSGDRRTWLARYAARHGMTEIPKP